jgi:hypothetical protein
MVRVERLVDVLVWGESDAVVGLKRDDIREPATSVSIRIRGQRRVDTHKFGPERIKFSMTTAI